MKYSWSGCVLIAAALWAAAQEPKGSLSGFFDGAKPSVEARPALPPAPPPAPGKLVVPKDLAEARARVGNQAQAELLARRNPRSEAAFTMAVIGDAEPGRFAWERVFSPGKKTYEKLMSSIAADAPDLIFQLGDMVSKGTEANYRGRVKYLDGGAGIPHFSVIGNHDRSEPNGAADKTLYHGVFGPGDFFVDYNGWRLIGLDTSDRTVTDEQVSWLKKALATDLRKIVFTHVPPRYLKGKLNTCVVPRIEQEPKTQGYIKDVFTAYFDGNAAAFDDLMAQRHVERVYFGHIHAFGMTEHRGTRYVLSGAGGSPLYPLPVTEPQCLFAHYIRVRLGPGKIEETVHALDGREFPLP